MAGVRVDVKQDEVIVKMQKKVRGWEAGGGGQRGCEPRSN